MLLFWYLFIHSVHCYCKNILGDVSRPSDYLHLQTAAVSTEWGQLCSVLHRLLQRQDTIQYCTQYSGFLVFNAAGHLKKITSSSFFRDDLVNTK